MQKVSDFVDIEAPCSEVFDTVASLERRMQLSPLWGLNEVLSVSPDFPAPGSSYRIRVHEGAPYGIAGPGRSAVHGAMASLAQIISFKMGQDVTTLGHEGTQESSAESAGEQQAAPPKVVDVEQEYFIQEYEPPARLSYALDADCKTIVTWKFQSIPRGTRLSYEEVFCQENTGGEDFLPTVRNVVHEWLVNIRNYSELRGTRGRLFARRILDRFFLKLRPDQRRTVLMLLLLQVISMVTFIIAVVALGFAGLFN